jgi:hypothetical protein
LAVLRGVSEGFTQQEDVLAQVRFFDKRVRPHFLEEFFLSDYVAAPAHQGEQRLEGFGSNRNGVVFPEQRLLFGIHAERPEFVNDPGCRSHILRSQQLEDSRMYPSQRAD